MEGLTSKYTREIMHDCFRQDLFGQLPLEIRIMISELIAPCWYLVVLGETRRLIERLRDDHETQSTQLRLRPDMWMSRINYRGTSYVARLSDKSLESTAASAQYHINLPSNIRKIVLSVNCMGVRKIQFVDHNSNPRSDGSPWYEVLDARDADLEAYVNCGVWLPDISRGVATDITRVFSPEGFSSSQVSHLLSIGSGALLSRPNVSPGIFIKCEIILA